MVRLLLLLVAVVYGQIGPEHLQSYEPGKTYTYQYVTQITTGLPHKSNMFSGMKLKTMVEIHCQTTAMFTIKFKNPTMFHLNDLVEKADPTQDLVPDEVFRPFVGDEANIMHEQLVKPCKFRYIKGRISNLECEQSDERWSVNVKKGMLTLEIMDLGVPHGPLDVMSNLRVNSRAPQSQTEVYSVMEDSVVGMCETQYSVTPLPSVGSTNRIYVTKTRNYLKCLNVPPVVYDMNRGYKCRNCESEMPEPVKFGCQVRAVLRGQKNSFVVESVISESTHTATLYSEKGGSASTIINQTLVLTDIKPVQGAVPVPTGPIKRHSLKADMKYSDQKSIWALSDSHQERQLSQDKETLLFQKLDKLLKGIALFTVEGIQEESGSLVFKFLTEAREANANIWTQLFAKYAVHKKPSDEKIVHIRSQLLDTLPFVGTSEAMEMFITLFKNEKLEVSEAQMFLEMYMLGMKPEKPTVTKLIEFLDNSQVRSHKTLKQSAWLCLGVLTDGLYKQFEKFREILTKKIILADIMIHKERRPVYRQELEAMKQALQSALETNTSAIATVKDEVTRKIRTLLRSSNIDDKILALKCLGNAGLETLISDVSAILEDTSLPWLLRSQAIWNLRKVVKRSPQLLQSILLPFYLDRNEDESVRVAAYMTLVSNYKFPRALLQTIALSLRRERNPQVGTFVYSHLKHMSKETDPCRFSFAKNASFVLRFARPWKPNSYLGSFKRLFKYNDNWKMGAGLEYAAITSAKEAFPRGARIASDFHAFGKAVDGFEFGFNGQGLSKWLKPFGYDRSTLQPTYQPDSAESRQSPQEQIGVTPRYSPTVKGYAYIKYLDYEFKYYKINEQSVMGLLQSLKSGRMAWSAPEGENITHINMYKTLLMTEINNVRMTESGLPIRIRLASIGVLKAKGEMITDKSQENMSMNLRVKASMMVQLRGSMEIDCVYVKSGGFVDIMQHIPHIPFNMTVNHNRTNGVITAKLDNSHLPEKLCKWSIKPQTFVMTEPTTISKWPSLPTTKVLDMMEGCKVTTFNYETGKNGLGIILGLKGQASTRNFNEDVPYYPLAGKAEMFVTSRHGNNPPPVFEMKMMWFKDVINTTYSNMHERTSMQQQSSEENSNSWFGSWFGGDQSQEYQAEAQSPWERRTTTRRPLAQESESRERVGLRPWQQLPFRLETTEAEVMQIINEISPFPQTANKYGMVVLFTAGTPNSNPLRQCKTYIAYQSLPNGFRKRFTMRVQRTPILNYDTTPWKMDVDANLNLPSNFVRPEMLFSNAYQQEVHRNMNIRVQNDGQRAVQYTLEDIMATKQWIQLNKIQSISNGPHVCDELINDMITKYRNQSEMVKIINMVQKQILLTHKAKVLKNKCQDFTKMSKNIQFMKDIITKSQELLTELESELHILQNAPRQYNPKAAILLKHCIYKQQRMQYYLKYALDLMKLSMPPSQLQDFNQTLSRQRSKVHACLTKEVTLLSVNKDTVLEQIIEHGEHNRATCLRTVKQVLLSQEATIGNMTSDGQFHTDLINKILTDSIRARSECKTFIMEPRWSYPIVQEKLKEAMVQYLQIRQNVVFQLRMTERTVSPQERKELLTKVQLLKEHCSAIGKVASQIVIMQQEVDTIIPHIISTDRPTYHKLQKIEQIQVMGVNRLTMFSGLRPDSQVPFETKKQVLLSVLQLAETSQTRLEQITQSNQTMPKSIQCISKIIQVSEKVLALIEKLSKSIKKVADQHCVLTTQKDPALWQAKTTVENMLFTQMTLIKKIQQYLHENASPSQVSERRDDSMIIPVEQRLDITITYGCYSQQQKQVIMNMKGKKSMYQLMYEQRQISPLMRSKLVRQYLRDREMGNEKAKTSYSKLMTVLNTFNHLHMNVRYPTSNFPQRIKDMATYVREYIKYTWYPHATLEAPSPRIQDGDFKVLVDFNVNMQKMDFTIMTPHETDRMRAFWIPPEYRRYLRNAQKSIQTHPFHIREESVITPAIVKGIFGVCKMSGETITTWDGHTYEIPKPKQCSVALAMDCSPDHRFSVTVRPAFPDPAKKRQVVDFVIDGSTLTLNATDEPFYTINGESHPIPRDSTVKVPVTSSQGGLGHFVPVVISMYDGVITCFSITLGLEVKTDGQVITLKIAPYHFAKVCGMCGNYDGSKSNDYEGPQMEQYSSAKTFASKYLLPNEQCTQEKIRQLKYSIEEQSGGGQSKLGCSPILRTLAKQEGSKICFSKTPVKKCEPGCAPSNEQTKRVEMHCRPDDKYSQEMKKQSKSSVLVKVEGMRTSKTEEIREPQDCIRA